MSLRARYCAARPFDRFLAEAEVNRDLWQAVSKRAVVSDFAVERVQALGGHWHLLVLADDWCGDAVNTLPVLARLADLADNLDLRVLPRDENPDLMDSHLSPRGARAIPVVMILDESFRERGWWGARPAELQRWVDETGSTISKTDRYREIRRWYARDKGATAVDEIIRIAERAAEARHVA